MLIYMYLCGDMHMLVQWSWGPEDRILFLGNGVTGSNDQLEVGAENGTQTLCKSSALNY